MLEGEELDRALTIRQAARVAGVDRTTITRWIASGHLYVLPKWGRERGDRVLLSEVQDCMAGRWKKSRSRWRKCPKDRLWYVRQIDRTRFRRLLETAAEREKRLAWQRTYQREYIKRKRLK